MFGNSSGAGRTLRLATALLLIVFPAFAQEGLYAPSAPEDASLVRVVNATPDSGTITVDVGPVRFRDITQGGSSPYRPVQPGVYVLFAGSANEVFTPEKAAFYTIVLTADRVYVFPDQRHTDPARAQLILYNITQSPVDLVALRPQGVILDGVAPGTSAVRAVNAIPVLLGVRPSALETGPGTDGAAAGADHAGPSVRDEAATHELALRRGESYGIVGYARDGEVASFVFQAAVQPE